MVRTVRQTALLFCWRRWALLSVTLTLLVGVTGCSLGVMAGKAFFGDPKQPSEFRTHTGVDLTKAEKRLLVVVTTPQAVEGEMPSLDFDLIEAITQQLKQHDVKVVDPDKVAKWIDQNGGRFEHPTELAQQFDTDFIAVVDLETFTLHDPNSRSLYHGDAGGQMQVYEVKKVAGSAQALQVFGASFRSQYPQHGPVPMDQLSPKMFQTRFLKHLSERLAARFYDYRLRDEM